MQQCYVPRHRLSSSAALPRVKSTIKGRRPQGQVPLRQVLPLRHAHDGPQDAHHQQKGPHGLGAVPHRRPDGTMELPTHHHFKPQDGRPHPHHHHQQVAQQKLLSAVWLTSFGSPSRSRFIPILIGIAFGMAASAIGMLVGQAVVFLWMRYRHNDADSCLCRSWTHR